MMTSTVHNTSAQHQLLFPNGTIAATQMNFGGELKYGVPPVGAFSSYGANNAAQSFGVATDTQKVLAVEYNTVLANLVNVPTPDDWASTDANSAQR